MVLNLCAITKVVLPSVRVVKLFWIKASLCVSKLEVASSRIKILGFAKIALAIAILCL